MISSRLPLLRRLRGAGAVITGRSCPRTLRLPTCTAMVVILAACLPRHVRPSTHPQVFVPATLLQHLVALVAATVAGLLLFLALLVTVVLVMVRPASTVRPALTPAALEVAICTAARPEAAQAVTKTVGAEVVFTQVILVLVVVALAAPDGIQVEAVAPVGPLRPRRPRRPWRPRRRKRSLEQPVGQTLWGS